MEKMECYLAPPLTLPTSIGKENGIVACSLNFPFLCQNSDQTLREKRENTIQKIKEIKKTLRNWEIVTSIFSLFEMILLLHNPSILSTIERLINRSNGNLPVIPYPLIVVTLSLLIRGLPLKAIQSHQGWGVGYQTLIGGGVSLFLLIIALKAGMLTLTLCEAGLIILTMLLLKITLINVNNYKRREIWLLEIL